MGCGNNGGQQQLSANDLSGGGMSTPASTMQGQYMSPLQMPQAAASMPTGIQPDQNTQQYAANLQYLQQHGAFDTPYQKAMKAHPIIMGLANAAQAFGQGLTKQPYYTGNQENQASLQNTQNQGVMNAVALPQQLRLMQALYGANPNIGGNARPTNIPGVAIPSPVAPVIPTPTAQPNPMAAQMAAAKAAGYSDTEIQAYLAGKK